MALVDQLNATTSEFYWPSVVSQVVTSTPFLTRLFKRKKTRGDGTKFRWSIAHKLNTGQWYSGYELLDVTPTDDISEAELDWVNFHIPLSISGDEIDKNQGPERIHDLLAEKMKLAKQAAVYYMGKGIWRGQAALKEPVGIYYAVAEAPTGTTYAGITRTTEDAGSGDFTNWFWNQFKDGGDAAPTLAGFEEVFNNCERGEAQPTVIVATREGYSKYWSIAQPYQRIPHDDISAIGFKSLTFNGVPVIKDDHCYKAAVDSTSSNYYFLHEPDLELRFITGKFMDRTEWVIPRDQDAMTCAIRNKFVFAVKTPKLHGVYHSCLHT